MMKTFVVYGFLYSVLKPQGFNANLTDKELLLRNSNGFLNSEDSKKSAEITYKILRTEQLTKAVEVVILVPPEAPTTNLTCPSESATILGHMEDSGLFPGLMKFEAEAGTPKEFTVLGVEKSSISLLNIIPVLFPTTFEPKL